MHWILQENLISPRTRMQVEALLRARGAPYTLARLVPLFNVLDNDVSPPPGPVFVYGSTGLGRVAKDRGWVPGYFDENLDYELMLEQYGEHALNARAVTGVFGELVPPWDRFFVRPVLDNKAFAGGVLTLADFEEFRAAVARVADDPDVSLRLSDRVVVAPLTRVDAEYRFFVVDGAVVTGSLYKAGDQALSSPDVPEEVCRFAQARVDQWAPNLAFALDVARTPRGLKVIEVNSANSAGFYACDVGRIIDAVNARLG